MGMFIVRGWGCIVRVTGVFKWTVPRLSGLCRDVCWMAVKMERMQGFWFQTSGFVLILLDGTFLRNKSRTLLAGILNHQVQGLKP